MTRVIAPRIARNGPRDLATYLLGQWHLEREIHDARTGGLLRFAGDAAVTSTGPTALDYREHGQLDTGETLLESRRAYHYELLGGARAIVTFEDGATFHALDLSSGADRVRHDCDEDLYRGLIITESDTWWTRWRVAGPAKDYIATTRAERVSSRPATSAT